VFHSTRHAIKTYLRGRVDRDVSDAITGHCDGSASRQYGETEIITMAKAIEKIRVRVQPQEGAARGSRRVAA
jgi:ribonuclease PH